MQTFSIKEAILFGWNTFIKRPWFFLGVSALVFLAYGVLSWITDPERGHFGFASFIFTIVAAALGMFVEMMLINIALKAHDNPETVQLSDASAKLPFWHYVAVKLLCAAIVIVGLVLLVVPGIIAALILLFANYLIVDKGLAPIEAMKESARITKGHRLQLFFFVLLVAVLNMAGALVFFVGLLVTVPITVLAMAHVYRTLEHKANDLQALPV